MTNVSGFDIVRKEGTTLFYFAIASFGSDYGYARTNSTVDLTSYNYLTVTYGYYSSSSNQSSWIGVSPLSSTTGPTLGSENTSPIVGSTSVLNISNLKGNYYIYFKGKKFPMNSTDFYINKIYLSVT